MKNQTTKTRKQKNIETLKVFIIVIMLRLVNVISMLVLGLSFQLHGVRNYYRCRRSSDLNMGTGNTFGKLFKISTFGESHGIGVGVIVDGIFSKNRDEILL